MDKVNYSSAEAYKKKPHIILRQELKSLTPNCNIKCAVICNLILIIIFVCFGVPIIVSANSVIEYPVDYTNW